MDIRTDFTSESSLIIETAIDDDWEPAMELAWKTFLVFEAPVYEESGKQHFLDFISGELLHNMFLAGTFKLAVARLKGTVVGMIALRSGSHISLLFVDERFHRKGIATKLVRYAQQSFLPDGNVMMTVNASPYGVKFYEHIGFLSTGEMEHKDGIDYLPMMLLKRV